MADDGYPFPVDLTSIMLFASSLGEENRIYWDEDYAAKTPLGSVIAPPTFGVVSSHWNPNHALRGVRRIPAPAPPPRPAAESRATAGGGASGGGGGVSRLLHGEQRFEYHRPIRPGMRLRVTQRPGRSWEKEGRRGGSMRFSESIAEYWDEQGELVLTATSVGIITGKAVEQT
jgi:hypothetical protein